MKRYCSCLLSVLETKKTFMSFQAQAFFWTYVLGKYLETEILGHMQNVTLTL